MLSFALSGIWGANCRQTLPNRVTSELPVMWADHVPLRSASVRGKTKCRIASMKNLCLIIVAITATWFTLHAQNPESDVEAKVAADRDSAHIQGGRASWDSQLDTG